MFTETTISPKCSTITVLATVVLGVAVMLGTEGTAAADVGAGVGAGVGARPTSEGPPRCVAKVAMYPRAPVMGPGFGVFDPPESAFCVPDDTVRVLSERAAVRTDTYGIRSYWLPVAVDGTRGHRVGWVSLAALRWPLPVPLRPGAVVDARGRHGR